MIPAYWSPTKKLMVLGAMAGGKTVEATALGNPLTFTTDKAKPLKSLLIPFSPVQSGTGDPSPSNIRPIVPWDGLSVWNGGGKNLFDKDSVIRKDGYTIGYDGISSESQTSGYTENFIPVVPNTDYTISGDGVRVPIYYDKEKNFIARISGRDSPFTFKTQINCYYVRLQYLISPVNFSNWQLEAGQTATAYEPYEPITETAISFPSPVYGGTLDVVSGVLTVEWVAYTFTGTEEFIKYGNSDHTFYTLIFDDAKYALGQIVYCDTLKGLTSGSGGDKTVPSIWLQSESAYKRLYVSIPEVTSLDAVKTAITGMTVVYPLATPQEIQLTPQQITALVGDNTIWSDANGQMTAVYLKKG